MTKHEKHRKDFFDLANIRIGKKARPDNAAVAAQKTISLLDLITSYGFTAQEKALLKKSITLSIKLMDTEIEAMHAIDGIFKDNKGEYTVHAEPNFAYATEILFNQLYFDAIDEIAKPGIEFHSRVVERLYTENKEIQLSFTISIILLTCATIALFTVLSFFFYYIKQRVIRPMQEIATYAQSVSQGNFDSKKTSYSFSDKNEIIILYNSIEKMIRSLKERINNAEYSAEAKHKFLTNMSHEIRTPINAIMGFIQLLSRSNLTEEQEDYLQKSYKASHILLSIINDILDLSKIEANKIELENIAFNLKTIVNSVVSIVEHLATEKNIVLNTSIDDSIPHYIKGDPNKLSQILLNLINNAIKFTNEGYINIDVSSVDKKESIVYIKFSVQDTGIGIDLEACKQLFKPFTQADSSITRQFGGTGLGLSICKGFIDYMGGEINVSSKPLQGSTFDFILGFEVANSQCQALEKNSEIEQKNYFDKKALVVEDNLINQEIAKIMLETEGLQVDIAENGQKCLEMLRDNYYDLIFMDMQMPVMNGIDCTKNLRNLGINIPIIAMTATVFTEDKEKCYASGMDDFISKPIMLDVLRNCLIKWL